MPKEYIEREAANEAAALIALTSAEREMTCGEVSRIMQAIPAANVRENVKGEWIKHRKGVDWQCSKCCWSTDYQIPRNFCPNCGADMTGGNDG